MNVYLASAASNRELNEAIAAELTERGHRCLTPLRSRRTADATRRRLRNDAAGIRDADLVLMVGPDVDVEVAWKAGYARALGKRVVLLCPMFETVCDHGQLADDIVRLGSLDDVGELVAELTEAAADRRTERTALAGACCEAAAAP